MGIAGATVEMEVLVTAKAYPSVSNTYGEAVCVAGIRLDTPTPEWVRFYPVRFRDLPQEQQFAKYEVIHLRAHKHSSDPRRETWRPPVNTIERLRLVKAGGHWPARRALVEPLVGPSMCELYRGRKGGGTGASLGLVRPERMRSIRVSPEEEWSEGQRGVVNQGSLLTPKAALSKPGHAFHYSYTCEEPGCRGHIQKIVDWELGEAYRTWPEKGDALLEALKARWLDLMCSPKREPLFFVGDQHAHPGGFLVLGTFYPELEPNAAQLRFELTT